ncbi:hypothetical protein [Pseudodesulfovibrio portus]|uniref:Uncharacterized protein n=1 Tax=Pseudodesulfovibrio portus TaxID=231439 RepID=A0ABN6RUN8_9BACT|nr:hypothetical protein [Pseudodesulfovibrio portus]BDQ33677.1 hypothetical protein JCM14722_12190 [Pseudodesulfovibrio portus]
MGLIKRLWRGEVDLARTFWVFGFTVGVLFRGAGLLLAVLAEKNIGFAAVLLSFGVFLIVYQVFISVAVWRSADRYQGYRGWAFLAKAMVVLGVVQLIAGLVGI